MWLCRHAAPCKDTMLCHFSHAPERLLLMLQAIYGKAADKRKAYDASLNRWGHKQAAVPCACNPPFLLRLLLST